VKALIAACKSTLRILHLGSNFTEYRVTLLEDCDEEGIYTMNDYEISFRKVWSIEEMNEVLQTKRRRRKDIVMEKMLEDSDYD